MYPKLAESFSLFMPSVEVANIKKLNLESFPFCNNAVFSRSDNKINKATTSIRLPENLIRNQ